MSKPLWGEACVAMGREQAAIALAVVSTKDPAHFRTTPGGYFHGMVAKAKAGKLNLDRTLSGDAAGRRAEAASETGPRARIAPAPGTAMGLTSWLTGPVRPPVRCRGLSAHACVGGGPYTQLCVDLAGPFDRRLKTKFGSDVGKFLRVHVAPVQGEKAESREASFAEMDLWHASADPDLD